MEENRDLSLWDKTKKWCKDHKKQLIGAGVILGAATLAYLGYKSGQSSVRMPSLPNPEPKPDDKPDEPEYDSLEYIDEDLYSDAFYKLEQHAFTAPPEDCHNVYGETRTYHLAADDTLTVGLYSCRGNSNNVDNEFMLKVCMIQELCPDIGTDEIVSFLRMEEGNDGNDSKDGNTAE